MHHPGTDVGSTWFRRVPGSLTFRLRVPGLGVARVPADRRGVSAIERFPPVFAALRALEDGAIGTPIR